MPDERKPLRPIVLASLLPPLVGVYGLAATSNPRYWMHASAFTWYAILLLCALAWASSHGWRTEIFLSIAALHLILVTPEIYLRWASFRYETGVQFGYPRPAQWIRFEPHEELFWTLPPALPGINREGFRAPELSSLADDGRRRILFLGDSVPHQGYPAIVETLLTGRPESPQGYRVIDLSMPGYSSHQGRVLVDLYGSQVAADVAVVSYGWNDHWLAWGTIDAEKKVVAADGGLPGAIYRRSRLLQAARWLSAAVLAPNRPLSTPRVPPDQYRHNLENLGAQLEGGGAIPLLLTPPTSHRRFGVPAFLTEHDFAATAESVLALHQTYNRIAREVAADRDWPLLDLAEEFEARADLEELFLTDGIHLTPRGLALTAHRVAARVAELGT